jgi:glycerophosphoryl diester phosphodiesterase
MTAVDEDPAVRCLRVGHSIVKAGDSLDGLAARLDGAGWDMVELDVLRHRGELVVAHGPADLELDPPLRFAEAVIALRDGLAPVVRFDVDLKTTGYELEVLAVLRDAGLLERALISTMELASLRVLRDAGAEVALGLSIPRARRDYLSHPLTRPAAYAMLAYLRRALPRHAASVLHSGDADAIMAHWGVVTPRLVRAVVGAGHELFVWTVDDPARLRALHALGVTGVITNKRDVFARAGL